MAAEEKVAFPCEEGCAACCKALGCKYLEGHRCTIYSRRPNICRVDKMYDTLHASGEFPGTWEEFIAANLKACDQLRATNPS